MEKNKKELIRCAWVSNDPLYIAYHDTEWGVPVFDDKLLFEFLVLEGAQAGLSWLTVLKKRENYRKALEGFDPAKVAGFNEKKIQSLLNDPGIIRNKLKVRSAVTNAKAFLEVQEEFGSFAKYSWQFVGGKPIKNCFKSFKEVPAATTESDAFSKDLKKRGFKFVGSTIIYAHMQAVGMVNDHTVDCFRYGEVGGVRDGELSAG
jgi:DNA-3-methyladenine glycosylase I